jgi:hypothetical protein
LPSGVVNHPDQGCSGEPQRMLFCDLITDSPIAASGTVMRQSSPVV